MSDVAPSRASSRRDGGCTTVRPSDMSTSLEATARFFMFSLTLLGIAWTLAGDPFSGLLLLSAGLLGWRGFKAGTIRSCLSLASILLAYVWAVPLGKMLTVALRDLLHMPFVPIRYLSILLAAVGILTVGHVLGTLASRWYRLRYGGFGRRAHLLGMCAGVTQGLILSATILTALLAVEPSVRIGLGLIMEKSELGGRTYRQLVSFRRLAESTAVGARLASFSADQKEVLEMGGSLAALSRFPGALNTLKAHPSIVQLIETNPAIGRIYREIKLDRNLKAGVRAGDMPSILNSSTIVRLLDDQELADAIRQYRDELFEAIMVSVPPESREQAHEEFAKLRGMPVEEFKVYARRRVAALADRRREEELQALRESHEILPTELRRPLRESVTSDAGENPALPPSSPR